MIQRINDKQKAILEYLAKYKFLTYDQMILLGIDKHKSTLSDLVSRMKSRKRALVKKIPHRVGVAAKFFLTKKGKDLLVEEYDMKEENILYPKGVIKTDTQDQKHRTQTISFQISLDKSCKKNNISVLFCDRYFDTVGNNRMNKDLKSKTAVLYSPTKSVKADIIFMLETHKQKELYLLELENGKDTKKAVEKCERHGQAIVLGSANEKYNHLRGYRSLWIFEHESIMNTTIKRLQTDDFFTPLTEYFLFNTTTQVEKSFFENWVNLRQQEREIYYQ